MGMVNEIICGACECIEWKRVDGKYVCKGCGYVMTEDDKASILAESYIMANIEIKAEKIEKMLEQGMEAEDIVNDIGMNECVNDYGMEQYVTGCCEDADCFKCWVDCITKKYLS